MTAAAAMEVAAAMAAAAAAALALFKFPSFIKQCRRDRPTANRSVSKREALASTSNVAVEYTRKEMSAAANVVGSSVVLLVLEAPLAVTDADARPRRSSVSSVVRGKVHTAIRNRVAEETESH